ncbi:hypothetical protein [Caldicellulosiruptor sp. DIB 104C]|uniref:hypothetical protein n=1 Tax=Caldicellulosiruptor sp. DIB 104C TaxID=3019889 RepID=UPI002306A362|nr:hypothetical protein [Caldicellulosiruptor sp. DIB 104C]
MLNKHRSFLKALSFLCILSLILSLLHPVGIWQNARADDVNVYNGGYDSYNGKGRDYWLAQAKVIDSKNPNQYLDKIQINGKDEYFNCEIYADRRMVVYGEPWDVPDNKFVWNFKEDQTDTFIKTEMAQVHVAGSDMLVIP